MIEIPLTGNEAISITLGGVAYSMSLSYNYRASYWVLNVYDANNNPLLLSVPLVVGANLNDSRAIDGLLFVVDLQRSGTHPSYDNLADYMLVWSDV